MSLLFFVMFTIALGNIKKPESEALYRSAHLGWVRGHAPGGIQHIKASCCLQLVHEMCSPGDGAHTHQAFNPRKSLAALCDPITLEKLQCFYEFRVFLGHVSSH